MLLQSLVFAIIVIADESVSANCKVGHLASSSNFTDEKYPSLARIVDAKDEKFVCNAVIISKNQLLTGEQIYKRVRHSIDYCLFSARSCLEGKRDPREIVVTLREFHRKESFANLTVSEIFFHPNWSPDLNDIESNSVIVITHERIPFDFFIFTTCFREFLISKGTEVLQLPAHSTCEHLKHVPKSQRYFEIPFDKSKSGVLYTQFESKWFLFGFFSEEIIEAKVCETKQQLENKLQTSFALVRSSFKTTLIHWTKGFGNMKTP
jgi:hypothetical protein